MVFDEDTLKRLNAVGIELVEALRQRLTWEHGRFTGALMSSIGYTITEDSLEIEMEDYAEYIEYGTPNPTTADEIQSWVEQKIIPNIKGKKAKRNSRIIAERLAAHISKYGPRPYPFVRMTFEEDLPGILARNGF